MGNLKCECQNLVPEFEIRSHKNLDDFCRLGGRDRLRHLIRKKYESNEELKIYEASEDEFVRKLEENPHFYRIMHLLSDKINQIIYENDITFDNNPPFVVKDTIEGEKQYYKGCFNNQGQCHGQGLWINNSNIYFGNFKEDEFSGQGLFLNSNGDYYFGEWENGKCNGKGELVFNGIKVYEGEYRDGKRVGKGVESFPDGTRYEGEFAGGVKSGYGEYKFTNGNLYKGNFKNSKYDGEGEFTWKNGQKYNGKFNNGKMNGQGTFFWRNGTEFKGNYSNNIKQGEGEYKWKDGSKIKGNWINNQPIGTGSFFMPINGYEESVQFKNGNISTNVDY